MTLGTRFSSRCRAATILATCLALGPIPAPGHLVHGRTSVTSGGAVASLLKPEKPSRAEVRRRLAERGADTYIGDILAERDSALSRWPDRAGEPLVVWIQDRSKIKGWTSGYVEDVRAAFVEWDDVQLPVRFAFTQDSAGNSALAFTRAGPEFAIEPGIAGQRIGYRFRDGAIEALYWPQLDNVPGAAPAAYVLARDVASFRVMHLASNNRWSLQWPPQADPKAGVPRAVQIEITRSDGATIERLIALR